MASARPPFTVCVLLFGDYPGLARRCLDSLQRAVDPARVSDFRVGMNAVSEATKEVAYGFGRSCLAPCHVYQAVDNRNCYKYPLMRRMLHDRERPPADRIMWFDDDSYLLTADAAWWAKVEKASDQACVLGSIYTMKCPFKPGQQAAIPLLPWYTGQPIAAPYCPQFPTGGWWVARTEILKQWDYPFLDLANNGGDSIFGELCRQQGYSVKAFRVGVAINYDKGRGGESRSVRRGDTTPWPWEGPVPPGLHDFEVRVRTFLPKE